ncbi:50S ribosomal protein L29 [Candidatus Kaiserbacteria bacterium]|nr:50S ribosomal protein L29 [Candidatus Kaiserbacteria bacterium]
MKKVEYSSWSIEDLKKEVAKARESLRNFRFGGAGSRTRNVREGRNLRREIARLLTELQSRMTK